MHKSKRHLRQRHGSDALRLERFDREDSSPSLDNDNEEALLPDNNNSSSASTPYHPAITANSPSPARLEPGKIRPWPRSNDSAKGSLHLHTQDNDLPPFDLGDKLPAGATTPLDSAITSTGNPISKYPPSPPTWSNMPHKPQLAILALSRFVDFFQIASLQTYMVHQLKSFDPEAPDSVISHQAGILLGSFTAAQIVTSILWGRAADHPGVGRKLVLNIGLVGTGIGCIGVGFSRSYHQAVFWRVLSGAINGTVGAARTMVAETVDKRWHPRAFLLLPAAFNFANMAGPILGGMLVAPVTSYPGIFGPNSTFGGPEGVLWMQRYPYAAANLLSTLLLFMEAVLVTFYLGETLKGFRHVDMSNFDPIRLVGNIWNQARQLKSKGAKFIGETPSMRRGLLSDREDSSVELARLANNVEDEQYSNNEKGQARTLQRLPFRRIWTSNVCWTLLSVAIFDFHMGAFSNLWILFLSSSRQFVPDMKQVARNEASATIETRSALKFSGGLAFPPKTIGLAMAIIGFIGIGLQFLLYPYANARFGLMRCFRFSLFFFPLAYFLAPFISLLPSASPSPLPSSGFFVWAGISAVLTLQVAARTFALPASIILVNNSSPHPSVLATIHGLGQADSATFRTLGPMLSGMWYGTWLERGVIGMSWWYVALISAFGCVASFKVRNGSGHEIMLPGEEGEGDTEMRSEPAGGAGPGQGSSGHQQVETRAA